MSVRAWIAIGLVAIVTALFASASCQSPTQVTLVLTTKANCHDVKGVDIVVGVEPFDTEKRASTRFASTNTTNCAPTASGGDIGTLVVTPGGERGSVIVIAGFLANVTTCEPPLYTGCIVARRSFGFVDNTPLTLPITLDPDCVDVPCNAVSTCAERKQCVSSEVLCNESGGCSPPGVTEDGGITIVDAGPLPDVPVESGSDAPLTQDASADAAPDVVTGDGGLQPIPTGAVPFGACPSPNFCYGALISCGGETCCYPNGGGTPECQPPATCAVMQREGVCCRQKSQCAEQEECCAKRDANGKMHVACAALAECVGTDPPALVCQTPGTDPLQCGQGRTCTSVALNHALYRCSN